jgi:hypothetical protein
VGPDHTQPVTVALLQDKAQIRAILGAGTHFILTKPLDREQAKNTLRAATALLKRERRQSARIPVQAAISLQLADGSSVEGILLDLSTGGMDVLAAKPLPPATLAQVFFELPEGAVRIQAQAEVAWSTTNGQIGLRFLEMDATMRNQMSEWLGARSKEALPEESEPVSQCKLTDLSLGGCYVETQSPFPQGSMIDLCLRTTGMEMHAEGLVRVMHPEHGMGIEFPSRTDQQRQAVADFIEFLTSQPGTTPQLEISPRALAATAVESNDSSVDTEEAEDALLELIRTGNGLEEEAFLDHLHRQRTADVAQ